MTYGYLKNRKDLETQDILLDYAAEHGLGALQFIYKSLGPVDDWMKLPLIDCLRNAKRSDDVIINDLREAPLSVSKFYQIFSFCIEMGITVHLIQQGVILSDNMDDVSQRFIDTISLASELDQMSLMGNVKEAKPSVRRGRPLSIESIRLDLHEEEIIEYLAHGSTMAWIARHFHVSISTVKNWVSRHAIGEEK